MSRITLDQISKMPAHIQAQVVAQMGAAKASAAVDNEAQAQGGPAFISPPRRPQSPTILGPSKPLIPSALDSTPVHIPAALLRHILENWGGAYYVCANETQRRRVVDNAIKSLAQTA